MGNNTQEKWTVQVCVISKEHVEEYERKKESLRRKYNKGGGK
jgi:hypothetical protein